MSHLKYVIMKMAQSEPVLIQVGERQGKLIMEIFTLESRCIFVIYTKKSS